MARPSIIGSVIVLERHLFGVLIVKLGEKSRRKKKTKFITSFKNRRFYVIFYLMFWCFYEMAQIRWLRKADVIASKTIKLCNVPQIAPNNCV